MKSKSSKYIELNTSRCIACWKCVDVCATQTIRKAIILWHKHIILRNPDNCSGCGKCIKTCQHGVICKIPKIKT
ncbi:MAG: DUF362 domain-containing protein [Dysgonomonas sp.]|uniref:DUF362 domain-containing protein n=1 Tax=Dysgonomonas sp. TaxID=1891233 RepID=UPI003A8476D9